MLASTRTTTRKKLAAAALAALLSAGVSTAAGEAAQAQTQSRNDGGQVVNRTVHVTKDRDYTGLWGLLGLLGLAGLAGLRRKRGDDVDVRRAPSARGEAGASNAAAAGSGDVERGRVKDSEVVKSTEGRGADDAGRVNVDRDVAEGQGGSEAPDARRTPSKRKP